MAYGKHFDVAVIWSPKYIKLQLIRSTTTFTNNTTLRKIPGGVKILFEANLFIDFYLLTFLFDKSIEEQ